MYWMLVYEVVDDYVERRAALRPEHLGLATAAQESGELVLAGAAGEPISSAFLVFRADDRSSVEAFVAADPYVREGLVTSWRIEPWHVVIGGDAAG
jgi:uncharacterized protein YciI